MNTAVFKRKVHARQNRIFPPWECLRNVLKYTAFRGIQVDKFKPSVVYIRYIEMPCNNFYIKTILRLHIVENAHYIRHLSSKRDITQTQLKH